VDMKGSGFRVRGSGEAGVRGQGSVSGRVLLTPEP
jgi:hypothetical protein